MQGPTSRDPAQNLTSSPSAGRKPCPHKTTQPLGGPSDAKRADRTAHSAPKEQQCRIRRPGLVDFGRRDGFEWNMVEHEQKHLRYIRLYWAIGQLRHNRPPLNMENSAKVPDLFNTNNSASVQTNTIPVPRPFRLSTIGPPTVDPKR